MSVIAAISLHIAVHRGTSIYSKGKKECANIRVMSAMSCLDNHGYQYTRLSIVVFLIPVGFFNSFTWEIFVKLFKILLM